MFEAEDAMTMNSIDNTSTSPAVPAESKPKTPILFFVKFFQKEEHRRDFIAGRLFMQSLSYFRGLEAGADGRGDPYEGALHFFPRTQIGTLQVGTLTIRGAELARDLSVHPVNLNRLNLFCLYAAVAPPFQTGELVSHEQITAHFRVPEKNTGLGPFAVIISPPQTLFDRFDAAVRRNGFDLERSLVTYFDPTVIHKNFEHPHFMKRNEYASQREYRFAIDRFPGKPDANECAPHFFEVGSLADICIPWDSATLNDELRVELK
jgi:hypothetical protein